MEHIANKNPFLIVVLGDFNTKMQAWYQNNITTFEGCKIDIETSKFGLSQIIEEPTHILSNSASCIDLTFTSQPNIVMHSGVHLSLHWNCYHQIVFAKFSLTIFYLPPYKQLAWHYQQANTDLIKWAIELFDWEKSLSNLDVIWLWTSLKILFRTKQSPVVTKILPGWINKLKHLLGKKSLI